MRNEKSVVGTDIRNRLRQRIPPKDDMEELTDDEILMLEALNCIEHLRWRNPQTVEAERIIRAAAAALTRDNEG